MQQKGLFVQLTSPKCTEYKNRIILQAYIEQNEENPSSNMWTIRQLLLKTQKVKYHKKNDVEKPRSIIPQC